MSEEPKPQIWACILAVLIGLPVLYAASFGPACWLVAGADEGSVKLLVACYHPIVDFLFEDGGSVKLKKFLIWYMRIGIPDGKLLRIQKNGSWVIPGFKR